jgi:hypothetical protein
LQGSLSLSAPSIPASLALFRAWLIDFFERPLAESRLSFGGITRLTATYWEEKQRNALSFSCTNSTISEEMK